MHKAELILPATRGLTSSDHHLLLHDKFDLLSLFILQDSSAIDFCRLDQRPLVTRHTNLVSPHYLIHHHTLHVILGLQENRVSGNNQDQAA